MVKINGKPENMAGKNIEEMLQMQGFRKEQVAVERNEEIVPKAQYGTVVLEEGDVVEVVSFVGGG